VTTVARVAFSAEEDRDAVDAFFAAAIANGATKREPGWWARTSARKRLG
jgi:hypothetical protein